MFVTVKQSQTVVSIQHINLLEWSPSRMLVWVQTLHTFVSALATKCISEHYRTIKKCEILLTRGQNLSRIWWHIPTKHPFYYLCWILLEFLIFLFYTQLSLLPGVWNVLFNGLLCTFGANGQQMHRTLQPSYTTAFTSELWFIGQICGL